MHLSNLLVALVLGLSLMAGCGSQKPDSATLFVLVAASLAEPMRVLASEFEDRHPGTRVVVTTGPSPGLAQQILAGAPADLFLSAHPEWVDRVRESFPEGVAVNLLSNRMVVVVPRGNPAGMGADPIELARPEVTRIAVAGEQVPAGRYADQTLRSLGLWESLTREGRLVRGSDVRVARTYVESGEADAGLVYQTEARLSKKLEIVAVIELRHHDPIRYPVLLLPRPNHPASQQLFEFVQSPFALRVFGEAGFEAGPFERPPDSITDGE